VLSVSFSRTTAISAPVCGPNMTILIDSDSHHSLKQVGADVSRLDLVTKTDAMITPQEFDTLQLRENSMDINATLLTDDQKLISNGSDTDDDEPPPELPPSLFSNAQTKRAQNALFEHYVREKDVSQLQELAHGHEGPTELQNGTSSKEEASVKRIIDSARDYQSELFAQAKAGNIIAVLDTGSGKTLIAALLLRDVVTKEMEDRASGKSPRTSFFLVRHVWHQTIS
jgi:hypothetical protein